MSKLAYSPNEKAKDIVLAMIDQKEELNIEVHTLENGTTVVDCGVQVAGGITAGLLFAEVCMGGLGKCEIQPLDVDDLFMPGIKVYLDIPAVGCMGCQYAGWAVKAGEYFAMGSGPARIKFGAEELMQDLGYKDDASCAVLAIEAGKLPGVEAADYIAGRCGVAGKDLHILAAPTASITGSLQIAARVVETGLHKLTELGFDIKKIVSGFGTCPLAPITNGDLQAIGVTNDCVLYGGRVWYTVDCEDSEVERILDKIPSNSSRDYGKPFYDLFKEYGDFYSIDPMLFSPAEVFINNIKSGRLYHTGELNKTLLTGIFGKSE
ncbi:MAG: methenyltetrahydromethanopterin cyclohydrolase [Syntrophaceticus sp.]